jgi:hypothetical protein
VTPPLPASYILMPVMQTLLDGLPTNERCDHLARLGRLHISEFTRENVLVRNKALLEQLNLH